MPVKTICQTVNLSKIVKLKKNKSKIWDHILMSCIKCRFFYSHLKKAKLCYLYFLDYIVNIRLLCETWHLCYGMWKKNRYLIGTNKMILTTRLSRHDDPLRAGRSPSVGGLMTIRRTTPRLALPVQVALPSELLPLALPCNLSKLQHYDTRD